MKAAIINVEELDKRIRRAKAQKKRITPSKDYWSGRIDAIQGIKTLCTDASPVVEALRDITQKYVSLINSGDCGNWNPETETEVISARAALSLLENKTVGK